jgi:hypothetical protein
VFGTVNVDVSSGLLQSDNASVLKGNTLSPWYWFRNRALEKSRSVSCILRAKRELLFSRTTATRQECEDWVARGGFDGSVLVGPHIESSTLGSTESIEVPRQVPPPSYGSVSQAYDLML